MPVCRLTGGSTAGGVSPPAVRAWSVEKIFMKLQYASFILPLHPNSAEQEELNRFLRAHRIVQTRKELAVLENAIRWTILVEYLDAPEKTIGETVRNKVDYKEILSPDDFTVFLKLRELRKKLSEEGGVPVYAVCTNEQLAEIVKRKPKNITECMKIDGVGQGKADKYFPAFLKCLTDFSAKTQTNEEKPDDNLF